jgi:type II secretory pathway component PulF
MSSEPSHETNAKLSPGETAELAAGVAELTKAGLPLPDGLRALAQELPGRRLRGALRYIADRLDRGSSVEQALDSATAVLPPYLHGLIVAGIRTGRLPEVMEEYVRMEETRRRIQMRLRFGLAYPLILAVILTIMVFLCQTFIIATFDKIFKDFQTGLPMITLAVMANFSYMRWIMIAVVAVLIAIPLILSDAPGLGWLAPAIYHIPILGTLLKYSRWAMFSRLASMLLEQRTPLPKAFRMIADGMSDPYLARACRSTAQEVEGGHSLVEAMMLSRWFPYSIIPFVQWGEAKNTLAEAFASATQIYEGRANGQANSLTSILMPFMLIFVLLLTGLTVIALFMPLISLITSLTGH